jgi:hypothetical protein
MNDHPTVTRRQFVKTTGNALTLGAALSTFPSVSVLGANEKLRLGFIGVGGRGSYHVKEFSEMDDVSIVAAADPAQSKLDKVKAAFPNVKVFQDFHALLDLKDVDAVVIATADHWHAIPTILACQAGKDVYVEKPLGHNIREGRAMVQAARKYNRVVQLGTQQRSGPHWIETVERVRSGDLGKVSLVRTWNCWDLKSIHADMGNPPDCDPPPGLHYDLWLGPAPKRPFNPRHTDFYFYYFNGNGYTFFRESDRANPKNVPSQGMEVQHKRNWIDCIRSRKRPNSDVELGHLGCLPGHLGNIAYRVGRRIAWDGEKETIPGDPQAEALLGRTYRAPYVLPKV